MVNKTNNIKFVNLTPHEIHEVITNTVIPSSGVARITVVSREVDKIGDIPIYQSDYEGQIEGLPEPKEEVVYIVSALCLNAIPEWRKDVVAPGNLVRDESGNPIGCKGFRRK